ncbi:MAG: PfkB family carbohydrate kinase, partial [Pseudomonadota bacterium]
SQSPAPVARVRDTTGAGDAFNAGVLAALLSQRDLQAAVAEGIALGRLAVQHAGAILSAEAIRRR